MKPHPLTKIRTFGMASAIAILLASPLAHAQIFADFTGGNGTTSVDQYQGIAGDGWTSAWATNTSGTNNLAPDGFTGTVTNASPLNGGGNYLSTTLTSGTGTAQGKGAQTRGYSDFGFLDLSAPYTVKFSMRLDSDLSVLSAANEYLQAFDFPGGGSDFAANGTWLIRAYGAEVNGIAAHTWSLYDGLKNSGGFSTTRFVSSGVSLVSGTVYDFVVQMDPTVLEYRVSINGGVFSDWLGYRRSTAPTSSNVNFGAQISPNETLTFSVDNIAVVPEPGTAGLCIAVGVLALAGLRRKRRQ